jgi:hypothetical protein
MGETTNRLKHQIVVIGANVADMPEELRRDSRILFLGLREPWKLKQQENVRVVIRPIAAPRAESREIDDAVREVRARKLDLKAMTPLNAERLQGMIVSELEQLGVPTKEDGDPSRDGSEGSTVNPEAPSAILERRRAMNMSALVRDLFEETSGELDATFKEVAQLHPDVTRSRVSTLLSQTRKWFLERDPDVFRRVADVKANAGSGANGSGKMNGHAASDDVQSTLSSSASGEDNSLPLGLSKSLRVFQRALQMAVDMLPTLIKAVEEHEQQEEVLKAQVARVYQVTEDMRKAVKNLA